MLIGFFCDLGIFIVVLGLVIVIGSIVETHNNLKESEKENALLKEQKSYWEKAAEDRLTSVLNLEGDVRRLEKMNEELEKEQFELLKLNAEFREIADTHRDKMADLENQIRVWYRFEKQLKDQLNNLANLLHCREKEVVALQKVNTEYSEGVSKWLKRINDLEKHVTDLSTQNNTLLHDGSSLQEMVSNRDKIIDNRDKMIDDLRKRNGELRMVVETMINHAEEVKIRMAENDVEWRTEV